MSDSRYTRALMLLVLVVTLNLPVPASLRIKALAADGFAPSQNVAWFLIGKGRELFTVLRSARQAIDTRRELAAENAELKENLRRLREMEDENRQLRVQLGFKQRSRHRLVAAQVIMRGDATGWWQTVRIDKGREHGIRLNMAAITTEGLLGRTMAVSRNTSDILLITDPNCRVSCKFERTEAFGVARGGGVDLRGATELEMLCAVKPFRVEYIAKSHHVFKGDRVVTSGLGGLFPEGLLIGRVVRSGLDESGLYRRATVEPAVDLGTIRYVFVVVEAGRSPGEPDASAAGAPVDEEGDQ